MSRRRAVCGQLTAAGTRCGNGPGCAVNHMAPAQLRRSAASRAAAAAGLDPLSADDAAPPVQGSGLSVVLDALQTAAEEIVRDREDEREPAQIRGLLFEPVANEWLMKLPDEVPLGEYATNGAQARVGGVPPQASSLERVVSWADFLEENPGWKGFLPSQDEGIDAVGVMSDGQFMAIQHKCWSPDAVLGRKDLKSFLALSASLHPGGSGDRLFPHKLLVMTFDKIEGRALNYLTLHDVLIMKRTHLEEHGIGWRAALDATRPRREQALGPPPRSRPELLDDGDWLRDQYETQRRPVAKIAAELGCSAYSVSKALDRHGIPTRAGAPGKPGLLDDGDWLRDQYETQRRSAANIAARLNRATTAVRVELRRHGIPPRSRPELLDDEGWLTYQYETQQRGVKAIANDVDCEENLVWKALHRHSIPIRPGNPLLDDGDWLRCQYETWGGSVDDIAGELRCDQSDVVAALARHGIPIRSHPGLVDNEGWLRDQYENQRRSVDDIAGELGCRLETVRGALARYGIPIRPAS